MEMFFFFFVSLHGKIIGLGTREHVLQTSSYNDCFQACTLYAHSADLSPLHSLILSKYCVFYCFLPFCSGSYFCFFFFFFLISAVVPDVAQLFNVCDCAVYFCQLKKLEYSSHLWPKGGNSQPHPTSREVSLFIPGAKQQEREQAVGSSISFSNASLLCTGHSSSSSQPSTHTHTQKHARAHVRTHTYTHSWVVL